MRARSARREAPFQRLRAICEHGRFLQRDLKGYIDGAKLPVPRAIQPTLRSFAFRLALKEGTYHFALKTPQAAAYAGLAWSRGGPGLPSGMGFSGDAAWLSTTAAGRFDALDRLATAARIRSAAPVRGAVRTNAQLVEEIGARADAWGARQGLTGMAREIGTAKHTYAKDLLNRYQSMYGDRGLVTESSWLGRNPATYGTKGSVRLDVWDMNSGAVWDYKFGVTPMSAAQRAKIMTQGPRGITSVTEVYP